MISAIVFASAFATVFAGGITLDSTTYPPEPQTCGSQVTIQWTYNDATQWANGDDVLIDLWRDGISVGNFGNVRLVTLATVSYPVSFCKAFHVATVSF